jgi:Domain of unknown function (DUF4252)
MNTKLSRTLFAFLIAISAARLAAAQSHDFTPRGIDVLRQSASSKTEFTLDHSMLVFASKMDPDNADLQRVIAGVNAVSVRSYRFPRTFTYDQEALTSVKEEYQAAGWKQLMNRHDKDGGIGATDLWVRLENNAISNIAVLQAKTNEVNFVVVSGSISPMDLSHLGGHFGIPKIEGGVTVPNTQH